jgi:crotonobetainyl-CoA:carnitine CoA-transferase CaiB-like acyl-CoA transferase
VERAWPAGRRAVTRHAHGCRPGAALVVCGGLAQSTIAAATLAAAQVDTLRTGRRQTVSVDMQHAALEFRSERYFRVDGQQPPDPWDKIAGLYRCGDGRWVRLHTNFPHHRDGVLRLLGCAYDRDAVAAALAGWQAEAFEDAAAAAVTTMPAARSTSGTATRKVSPWRACR